MVGLWRSAVAAADLFLAGGRKEGTCLMGMHDPSVVSKRCRVIAMMGCVTMAWIAGLSYSGTGVGGTETRCGLQEAWMVGKIMDGTVGCLLV